MGARHYTALLAALLVALPVWAQGPAGSRGADGGRKGQVQVSVGISSGALGETFTSAKGSTYAYGESVVIAKPVTGDAVAAGGSVDLDGDIRENAILAGGNIRVRRPVGRDAIAAGGNVEIEGAGANAILAGGNIRLRGTVGQDAIVAGGNVEIEGVVADDVRAAGGTLTINSRVGGDVLAAGGNVSLGPGAVVAGGVWLVGSAVNVRGTVAGDVRVRGETVHLDATVRGSAELRGRRIVVGPTARVAGRLVYASPNEAQIDPGAQIAGGIERLPAPPVLPREAVGWLGLVVAWVIGLVALLVTATVLRWVFPRASVQAAATLTRHPWKSLALGFALLLCIPAAAVVLFVTLIGTPLGLVLLLLYPLALGLGWFVFAVWIAEMLGQGFFGRGGPPLAWRLLLLWLGVLVMALVCLIPWLGQLALFVALLFGLGALGLHLAARYMAGGAAPGR